MKVIIKEWTINHGYQVKAIFPTKKAFMETYKTKFVSDGMEELSLFEQCLTYYIQANGHLDVIAGSKHYNYKNGRIREFNSDGILIRTF